jgi:hypothetical protein
MRDGRKPQCWEWIEVHASQCTKMRETDATRSVCGHIGAIRKTDVNDAMWLAELLAHGLIRASFVPDARTQEMRKPAAHAQAIGS